MTLVRGLPSAEPAGSHRPAGSSLVDRHAAGLKADARRVINLYRGPFDNAAKRLARSRSIEALRAAGAQTVLCLWGGGLDAEELVAAGFRVIAVDNGSMVVVDRGRKVSNERKKRALAYAGEIGGYETRWGDAHDFMPEADAALLDFHGPWSLLPRKSIAAGRHMTAIVVTLTPSHDMSTDATSPLERQMAYQVYIKLAWAQRPRWEAITAGGHVRRLTDYHEDQGRNVFVYLLARKHIVIGTTLTTGERSKMRRDMRERRRGIARRFYERNRGKILEAGRAKRDVSVEKTCPECEIVFLAGGLGGRRSRQAKYCSAECEKAAHYRSNRASLLRKRAAAVRSTTAEALDQAA